MKKLILAILFSMSISFAQGTAGTNAKYEYRSLIDLPSAGILEKGFVGVSADVLPYGVVISKIEVGVFDNFSFGISLRWSKHNWYRKIDWYELPGVNVRARLVDETESMPAFTLGFDSQGKGLYDSELNRFEIKSPGFYVAAAKNFELLGYLSLHGIINYSLERDDDDKDLNLGVGFEKTVGDKISIVGEYNFAINDNSHQSLW
ncbi:MAG: hypothetical protein U5K00_13395 [Melioribacteraceae bacterium]|nr:hypothetical protein [Melioribacteraceae bacterium]